MSGENVPYQLRPNKFVERQLFYELLGMVDRATPMCDYAYFSMGGKFLVDHKSLHSRFQMKSLFSIEECPVTYKRQLFNRPFKFIRCFNEKSGDFVGRFDDFVSDLGEKKLIAWLDYVSPKDRRTQLEELESLISKLRAFDIFKITLNAAAHTLNSEDPLVHLRNQLGEDAYFPSQVSREDVRKADKFAVVLSTAVQRAVLKGAAGTPDIVPKPLSAFRYSDGNHQMLTVTGILLPVDKKDTFLTSIEFESWEFGAGKWNDVHNISVPDLSEKERRFVDERLFSEPIDELHATLSFKFDGKNDKSIKILEQYLTHYRRYPSFVTVGR
jgi:hypothetical protein